jgi:hypothetical protein
MYEAPRSIHCCWKPWHRRKEKKNYSAAAWRAPTGAFRLRTGHTMHCTEHERPCTSTAAPDDMKPCWPCTTGTALACSMQLTHTPSPPLCAVRSGLVSTRGSLCCAVHSAIP